MDFKLTSDTNEMEYIAKRIIKEKPNIYTSKTMDTIRGQIASHVSVENVEQYIYKTIYYYWAYGCSADEYFYYDFENKTPEEVKKYVTVRERIIYTDYLNRIEDIHILGNKWEAYRHFSQYYKRDIIRIESDEDFPQFLNFVKKHEIFVVKPADLGLAQGVHKVSTIGYSEEQLYKTFQNILAEISANAKVYKGSASYIILEEVIAQSAEMGRLHPESANALRITTVRVKDEVKILHPWIKIGRGGQFITSAACGTFIAGINPETGIVETDGFTERGESYAVHPETNVAINGFKIPRWQEAVAFVKEIAFQLPTIAYVGWDMVLTDNGWVIMEGNPRGEFMWQLYLKRGGKSEFEELIGWSIDKEFWWQ